MHERSGWRDEHYASGKALVSVGVLDNAAVFDFSERQPPPTAERWRGKRVHIPLEEIRTIWRNSTTWCMGLRGHIQLSTDWPQYILGVRT